MCPSLSFFIKGCDSNETDITKFPLKSTSSAKQLLIICTNKIFLHLWGPYSAVLERAFMTMIYCDGKNIPLSMYLYVYIRTSSMMTISLMVNFWANRNKYCTHAESNRIEYIIAVGILMIKSLHHLVDSQFTVIHCSMTSVNLQPWISKNSGSI